MYREHETFGTTSYGESLWKLKFCDIGIIVSKYDLHPNEWVTNGDVKNTLRNSWKSITMVTQFSLAF